MSKEMASEEGQEIDVVISGEEKPQIKPFAKDHIPGMHRNEDTVRVPPTPKEHQQAEATAREFLAKKVGEAVQRHAPEKVGVEPLKVAQEMLEQVNTKPDIRLDITQAELAMADLGTRLFDPEWDLDILRDQADKLLARVGANEDRILRAELDTYEAQFDAYLIARNRLTPLSDVENQEFERIQQEFRAIFLLNKANVTLGRGVVDKFAEIKGGDWSKESFEAIMEKEGVKEGVTAIEASRGIIFWKPEVWVKSKLWERKERLDAGDSILTDEEKSLPRARRDRIQANYEDLIRRVMGFGITTEKEFNDFVVKKPEERLAEQIALTTWGLPDGGKKSADLTIKLFHFYGISGQYCGPVEDGRLVEEEIIERVFGGGPIDMTSEKYWGEWDLFRRKRDLGLSDLGGDLPYALRRAYYAPEFLKTSPFVSRETHALRKYFETRYRSTAYMNHVRTMSELYAKRGDINHFGDGQIFKGSSDMMVKVAAKDGFLDKPIVSPSAVFKDAKKALPEILKPYLELAGLFTYLTYYGDPRAGIDANREPDKIKGYIFSGLMRWVNTWEAQGMLKTRILFGLLPGKEWGRVEYYDAIDVAREKGAFDLEMDSTLERAFGTSKATSVTLQVVNRVPGALLDVILGIVNAVSPIKFR